MDTDPCVYIIMCTNTNGEVMYSTTHLFNYENEICCTRTRHGNQNRDPYGELGAQLEWGAAQLNDFFTDLYGSPAT